MYISSLTIENFKGFKGKHEAIFGEGLIFFVGDNNTGKSTVFEAIDFIKTGIPSGKTVGDIKNKTTQDDVTVTLKLKGNIKVVIKDFSETKYEKFVFEEDGHEMLLARRSSKVEHIKQSGKDVELDISKVALWNPETGQYENPSGVDKVFKTLFEAQFVWADTNPDDISDFGATKICGRLLNAAVGDFFETNQWKKFAAVHKETFHEGKDSLSIRAKSLETKIQDIMVSQYGDADVSFSFNLPDIVSFLKSGSININDGVETASKAKGTGMQRALALALIQIYADELAMHTDDPEKAKPLFLFIDEPETFMHPRAQKKFLDALSVIADVRQIFVTTHSPYLLKSYSSKNQLFIFTKDNGENKFDNDDKIGLFRASSPTWGEINFYAYGMPTVEFHNELYGFLQAEAIAIDERNSAEKKFDAVLVDNGQVYSKKWTREKGGKISADPNFQNYDVMLQTFIRNKVHHPENGTMKSANFTQNELGSSITEMTRLIGKLR